jgi:hypothetical protein
VWGSWVRRGVFQNEFRTNSVKRMTRVPGPTWRSSSTAMKFA